MLFLWFIFQTTEFERKNPELKHLGFVRYAAIRALVCVSNLYDYAKQNSGPLRSTVGTVEGTVNNVLGPVYHKLKGVPDDLLVFVDNKVFSDFVFLRFLDFFFKNNFWIKKFRVSLVCVPEISAVLA